jgi:2-C-methyl-D-erythritol 4-phosphate cytidylyltransferase
MTHAPRYFALIPAAGVGARMAAGSPKQYLKIGGKPMLRHTLDAFLSSDLIAHTFVVVSPDDPYIDAIAPHHGVTILRCGGATRMESVRNGLAALNSLLAATDWVLALPVVDTVKRCIEGEACGTVPRNNLWLAQTPQMFRYQLLREALGAATDPATITDDASAVEALGLTPKLVEGHPRNLKVTMPDDIRIAEMYLAVSQPEFV